MIFLWLIAVPVLCTIIQEKISTLPENTELKLAHLY
jgi:hypothetical protein